MKGAFTSAGTSLALLTSPDGFAWQLAEHPLVARHELQLANGETLRFERLERPQLYLENGRSRVLFCAALQDPTHQTPTFNLAIPLQGL